MSTSPRTRRFSPSRPQSRTRGYSRDEAIAEAARCFPCRCMECVKACEYLKAYGSYPKRYVRDIYNNLGIVLGNRKSNRMIDSCALCGLCDTVCPNDLSMGEVCLEARRNMVESGHMPASHHDFALRDMAHSHSEAAALARAAPGEATCRVAFFPGCQLAASSPWHVESVYNTSPRAFPGSALSSIAAGRRRTGAAAARCMKRYTRAFAKPGAGSASQRSSPPVRAASKCSASFCQSSTPARCGRC